MPAKRKKSNLIKKTRATKQSMKRTAKKTTVVKKAVRAKAATEKAAKGPAAGSLQVFDMKAKPVGTMELDAIFKDGPVNTGVIYQAVLMYQACEREGTASTKTRGEVRGGGKKPWKQKGTGQARHGSRRSPIWRGGGTTFGPHPRDYSYTIPQKIRRQAMVEGFKDKVQHGKMIVVDQIEIPEPKTSRVADILDAFKLERPLVVVGEKKTNLVLASRNIQGLSLKTASEVNVLDVARHREFVITKAAYAGLVERLKS